MAKRYGVTGLKQGVVSSGVRRGRARGSVVPTALASGPARDSQVASAVKRGVTVKQQTGVPAGNYTKSTKRRTKVGG